MSFILNFPKEITKTVIQLGEVALKAFIIFVIKFKKNRVLPPWSWLKCTIKRFNYNNIINQVSSHSFILSIVVILNAAMFRWHSLLFPNCLKIVGLHLQYFLSVDINYVNVEEEGPFKWGANVHHFVTNN